MFLKRISLSLLTAWATIQLAHAVNAFPRPIVVTQADGTQLTIVVRGNEHGHITMTADGYPLWFNATTENYEYATLSNGEIAGSGIVAADADKRSDIDNAYLSTLDSSKILTAQKKNFTIRRAKANTTRALINNFPTIGEVHSLVILVEFSDQQFSTVGDDANDFFTRMLNEKGFTYKNGANGSVRDYYVDNSEGKFLPTFDVVGPLKMPNTVAYYGANNGGYDNYDRIAEMITTACTMAHESGTEFAQYDHDGDGRVDNVYVIYAGFGEADSGKSNTIWPHAAYLSTMVTTPVEFDDRIIDSYTCCNEINGQLKTLPMGIGMFVHEFGHVLGIPDIYDIYGSSACFTPQYYDVMDVGSYNNKCNTPPNFSAYERGELGWLDFIELSSDEAIVKTLPELSSSNKAYRVSVAGNDNEYYVLENRQLTGWDEYLPGHGMLMWHIDYDKNAWLDNTVNSVASHQRVDLVEADNKRTDSSTDGDPFPGTSNVTSWEMDAWDGTKLASLDDIKETDGNIELVLGDMDYKIESPTITVSDIDDTSATISWNSVDVADKYFFEIFKDEATLEEDSLGTVYEEGSTITIDSLQPETNYTVIVRAIRGSYQSELATASFTTTATPFAKKKVTNLSASDITASTFELKWDGIDNSKEYEVTLTKHTYDNATTATVGYDFSQQEEGMPELWEYKGGFFSITNNYGESAPSLRFPRTGGYLTVAYPEKKISSISFWGKGTSTVDGNIQVEGYENGSWKEIATFAPTSEAQTYTYSFTPCEKVRINMESNSGAFYIDDVKVTCSEMSRELVKTLNTTETTTSFSGLDNDAIYGVTIVAISNDGERSATSDELVVDMSKGGTGITTVVASPANGKTAIYDINGRQVTTPSSLGHGIYIIKKGDKVKKAAY